MKRKLNENDVPEEVAEPSKKPFWDSSAAFDKLGLDPRLLQGILNQKFSKPTPIQARAIPLAFEGKDILARSRTGSGKTAAYVLPILQSILKRKDSSATKSTSALILVPTNELAGQVTKAIQAFASFCAQHVRAENLARKEDDKVQRARLADNPDIIVATPFKAAMHINSTALKVDSLKHLVIDEADLVLAYCNNQDLESVQKALPVGVQAFIMSATLGAEVETLKKMFCTDPVVLQLDDEEKGAGDVAQYVVKCGEEEKFLLIYAIFMLKLIKGKTIVFVQDIDRCYRLKLFLEQFGIKSCVLNSELPVNSRIHVVEEFNKGVYDIIIASDEHEVIGNEDRRKRSKVAEEEEEEIVEDEAEEKDVDGDDVDAEETKSSTVKSAEPPKKRRRKDKRDRDYGVARGIDFKNVACVLNFDLPTTSKSYTHRIGRTARAGQKGMALSFVIPKNEYRKHRTTTITSTEHDEKVLEKIKQRQAKKDQKILPYAFDMTKLDGFRYRLGDALRAVTSGAIREARLRELRQELIKSEKLKRHFEENPDDLRHLRHDGELRAARVQPHLKHVPEYLLPGGGRKVLQTEVGFVGVRRESDNRVRRARETKRRMGKVVKPKGKKVNPLQTFKTKSKK
ncbi:putative glucan endo-1-3-beta-glucosidase [Venturia nashicola]|uniref:RNA helicase n=1 Tax=Venturia nashicola TaxID=86259 RepID=A0A4Z1P926_9PEZI|nr:putative glucan endo-1-3-beta-glucosidase [Venturia nashicola]